VNTKDLIAKAQRIYGNAYSYRLSEYKNSKTHVVIECPIHGPFDQLPGTHLRGAGCKRCADVARGEGSALKAAANFLEKVRAVHGDRYDCSETNYVRSGEKVTVSCFKHGKFSIRPNNFLRGIGCTKCGDEAMAAKQSKGTRQFVKDARKIHLNRYDYSAVSYVSTHKQVEIRCPDHGVFYQAPSGHLNGRGCPKCGIDKNAEGRTRTLEDFIATSRQVHGDKYDYSQAVYVGSEIPLTIICPVHGAFRQRPQRHAERGQGCPKCANRDMDLSKFIERARAVHQNRYDYGQSVYMRARDPLIVACPDHGPFEQRADHHLRGIGCPLCVDALNSKGIRKIEAWLTARGISYEREKSFNALRSVKTRRRHLRFDFWLPKLNAVIEFDGRQHFQAVSVWGGRSGFDETVARDRRKDEWTAAQGIQMIRVRHDQEQDLELILGTALGV
jgi:very-short-patch-repair endonuclease